MIDKHAVPTKLLWVDLEMTGLDPERDIILEVAAEVTDFDFNQLGSFQALVKQPKEQVVELMQQNSFWEEFSETRETFISQLDNGQASEEVENQLVSLVEQHFDGEPAVLAGNSIYNDRKFIQKYWPRLDSKLHYRMLDVSAWKVFMQGKHGVQFEKPEVHRAHDDIQASIAELKYYLGWFATHGS
jgi:oligoribonuclease